MGWESMITSYIKEAMHRATYRQLEDDGTFVGEIPGFDGVWSNAPTLEGARDELREVLEEWIVLGLELGHDFPELGDKRIRIPIPT
jgi:predicted RNase H-like HicB family nuclease